MNLIFSDLKKSALDAAVKGLVWGMGILIAWSVTIALTADSRQKATDMLRAEESRQMQAQIREFTESSRVREINAKNEAVQREADILKRVAVLEAAPAVPALPPPLPGVESTTQPRAALVPPRLPVDPEVLVPEPGGVVIVKPSVAQSPRDYEKTHREVYVPPPPSPVQMPPSAARD